jgi:aminocarboxymuconate-semialdehyde decarboxylase
MTTAQDDIIVSPVETEKDIIEANLCVSEAFGRQVKDAVWIAMVLHSLFIFFSMT